MSDEGTSGIATAAPAPVAGQAQSATTESQTTDKGQGSGVAPATAGQAQGAAIPNGESGDNRNAGTQQEAGWDGDTLKWLSSKGYDSSAYDPKNETHSKTLKQLRELESSETRRRQHEAAERELDKVRKANPPELVPDDGPLKTFEKKFDSELLMAMKVLGVNDLESFYKANPTLYAEYQQRWPIERQKAWEEHQTWQKEQEAQKQEQDRIKKQYFEDFEKAKTQSKEVLNGLKKDFPNIDNDFARHGVNALTNALAEKYSVYPEMLFLDEKVARFFAEAATAIAYRYDAPAREQKLIEEYEKKKIKLAEATGPRPAGTSSQMPVNPHGKGSWLGTLEKHSHEFQK